MDISGLSATQSASTEDCKLHRNTKMKAAEGGTAAQATSPERNYAEAGREAQGWGEGLAGTAGGTRDALGLVAVV